MSSRALFFHSVSTIYRHRCGALLDYLLAETDDLVAQIQYQRQRRAPFWHLFLRADGTIVQICRNMAGYYGESCASMRGRPLWPFLMDGHPERGKRIIRQVLETGQTTARLFPSQYGRQVGAVSCRIPWRHDELGDIVTLLWPLEDERAWAAFAFRSFDGLRIAMLLDIRGRIVNVDPVIAGRLGGTPQGLIGQRVFERFPPEKARRRWAGFRDTVWTGRAAEWMETGESGVRYDNYMVPIWDDQGQVKQVLVLARDQNRVFAEAPPARMRVIE